MKLARRIGRLLRKAMPSAIERRLPDIARRMFTVFHALVPLTRLGRVDFYPARELAWTAPIEAEWRAIRAEIDTVLADLRALPNVQDVYAGQETIANDDKWKALTFCRGPGGWDEAACRQCPQTHRLLAQVPGLWHAMFSILAPHKHIPAHKGVYGGLVDCHLGLVVPEPAERCRIRVGTEVRQWEEGRFLVFDDSHEHEVWNDTEGVRAVLLMYVVRPLPAPLSWLNMWILRFATRVF